MLIVQTLLQVNCKDQELNSIQAYVLHPILAFTPLLRRLIIMWIAIKFLFWLVILQAQQWLIVILFPIIFLSNEASKYVSLHKNMKKKIKLLLDELLLFSNFHLDRSATWDGIFKMSYLGHLKSDCAFVKGRKGRNKINSEQVQFLRLAMSDFARIKLFPFFFNQKLKCSNAMSQSSTGILCSMNILYYFRVH